MRERERERERWMEPAEVQMERQTETNRHQEEIQIPIEREQGQGMDIYPLGCRGRQGNVARRRRGERDRESNQNTPIKKQGNPTNQTGADTRHERQPGTEQT